MTHPSSSESEGRPRDILLLVVLSALVLFPALGQNSVWASREIRHAEIIREMAVSGHYLVPTLLGETYRDKPPVMHTLAALFIRMAGEPNLTLVRLPSALAGALTVLAAYGLGLLLLNRSTALVGAIALLGIPGFSGMAREARPDMIFCAAILLASLGLARGMREEVNRKRTFFFSLAGLVMGVAVITKGPLGLSALLVPLFAPIRRTDLKRPGLGWIGFGLGFLIAIAAWAVPAYLYDHGQYLHDVVFQPDLDVTESQKPKPFLIYLWLGIALSLPLSLFLPLAIVNLRRRGYSPLLVIAAVIFLIVSCVPKKRSHYLLPMYPFLSLAIADSIVRWSETSRLVRRAAWTLIPVSLVAMPLYFAVLLPRLYPQGDPELRFAREVLAAVEPKAKIFCVKGSAEALAWVGRRDEGIYRHIDRDPAAIQSLHKAGNSAYLVILEKRLPALLEVTGPLDLDRVLESNVETDSTLKLGVDWRVFPFVRLERHVATETRVLFRVRPAAPS